jgi:hypothetical protein
MLKVKYQQQRVSQNMSILQKIRHLKNNVERKSALFVREEATAG